MAGLVPGVVSPPARPWRADDERQLPALLQRAYLGVESPRPFATSGTLDGWREYVSQLLRHADCGTFRSDLSLSIDAPHGELGGAAVLTALSARTVHLAQIAVDLGMRGQGAGQALLVSCAGAAAASGATAMTLLVAASNWPAVALYESQGFRDVDAFVLAMRRAVRSR